MLPKKNSITFKGSKEPNGARDREGIAQSDDTQPDISIATMVIEFSGGIYYEVISPINNIEVTR